MFSYRQQDFPFPDSVIYQILKNPPTPEAYQKLIETCKYFFAKNPILIVHCLFYREHWSCCYDCTDAKIELKPLNFKNSVAKIWITKQLSIAPYNRAQKNVASSFSSRIYQPKNAQISYTVLLENQTILYKELLNFSAFRTVRIKNINVIFKDGSKASLDEILNVFTNAKIFAFKFADECSPKTVENFLKVPHFSNLFSFNLENIDDSFDIIKFYKYLKTNNKNMGASLAFNSSLSDHYRNRLNQIIDELVQIPPTSADFIPLAIGFPEKDNEKVRILGRNLILWYENLIL